MSSHRIYSIQDLHPPTTNTIYGQYHIWTYSGLSIDNDDVSVLNEQLHAHRPDSCLQLHLAEFLHAVLRVHQTFELNDVYVIKVIWIWYRLIKVVT